jgi:hypothetical protein
MKREVRLRNPFFFYMPMILLGYKKIYFNTRPLIIIFLLFVFLYYKILKISFLMSFLVDCQQLGELSTKLILYLKHYT